MLFRKLSRTNAPKLVSIPILMVFNSHWKVQRNQITIDDAIPGELQANENKRRPFYFDFLRNDYKTGFNQVYFLIDFSEWLFAQDNINLQWYFCWNGNGNKNTQAILYNIGILFRTINK